jgi:hypothetical protein
MSECHYVDLLLIPPSYSLAYSIGYHVTPCQLTGVTALVLPVVSGNVGYVLRLCVMYIDDLRL